MLNLKKGETMTSPNEGKFKYNPRLLTCDVYEYVASNSSLTKKQVKECFNTYRKMLGDFTSSEYLTNDLTISLPKIGYFYLKKKGGRKKGSTYTIPIGTTGKLRTIHLEEDEEDRYKIAFKISTTNKLNQNVRQVHKSK